MKKKRKNSKKGCEYCKEKECICPSLGDRSKVKPRKTSKKTLTLVRKNSTGLHTNPTDWTKVANYITLSRNKLQEALKYMNFEQFDAAADSASQATKILKRLDEITR